MGAMKSMKGLGAKVKRAGAPPAAIPDPSLPQTQPRFTAPAPRGQGSSANRREVYDVKLPKDDVDALRALCGSGQHARVADIIRDAAAQLRVYQRFQATVPAAPDPATIPR